jgi:hypothetical protein
MSILFRAATIAGALALSTAAFAGNDEGNKPLNNVAVTAPPVSTPENRSVQEGRAAAEERAPQKHRTHHTSGMGSSQSTKPQSAY